MTSVEHKCPLMYHLSVTYLQQKRALVHKKPNWIFKVWNAMFRKTLFKTSCKVWMDQSNWSKYLFQGETADYPSSATDIKQRKNYFKTGRDVEIKIAYKPGLLPCSLAGKRFWFSKTAESSTPVIHLHQIVSNHISNSLSSHTVSAHPLLPVCL